jgi:C4-dicarboxylate-specific signal transduction histidine kinase
VTPTWLEPEAAVWVDHPGTIIHMIPCQIAALEQVRAFLSGTSESTLTRAAAAVERYAAITQVLRQFGYRRCHAAIKDVLELSAAADEILASATHALGTTVRYDRQDHSVLSRTHGQVCTQVFRS